MMVPLPNFCSQLYFLSAVTTLIQNNGLSCPSRKLSLTVLACLSLLFLTPLATNWTSPLGVHFGPSACGSVKIAFYEVTVFIFLCAAVIFFMARFKQTQVSIVRLIIVPTTSSYAATSTNKVRSQQAKCSSWIMCPCTFFNLQSVCCASVVAFPPLFYICIQMWTVIQPRCTCVGKSQFGGFCNPN